MSGSLYPIDITFGRQDEQSEPTPSQCTFYLKNDTGFWSPGNAAAPANWRVGCPVNVRLTHSAVTYDRFTGYVDSIEPTWPGGVQSWSVVKVTATDATARLGLAQPLRALVDYEMLALSPTYYYALDEPAGSTSCADTSGNNKPVATRYDAGAGAYVATLGVDMGMLDATTGASFGSAQTGDVATSLSLCRSGENVVPAASGHTQVAWVVMPDAAPASLQSITFMCDNPDKNTQVSLCVNAPNGKVKYSVIESASNFGSALGNVNLCDGGLHMIAGTLEADRKTVKLYIDGALQTGTSLVASSAMNLAALKVNEIGAITMPSSGANFPGVIGRVAMYSSALTAAQILTIYQAGVGANSERSDLRFSRIAGYGGITTSGLPTGKATMGGQKTGGKTAVEALRDVARTEGTLAYVTGAGALTFQARDDRYNKAVGLSLASSDIEPGFMPRQDRMGQINEITVTRAGGASQRVVDSTAQAADGRRDGGSFDVYPSTDDDALQNASWQIANHKDPLMRVPDLVVNLLGRSDATTTACLAAGISTVAQVTGLPSNGPATTVTQFVEGWRERIALNDWRISYFTSPVVLDDNVLILDDATKGTTNSTNVLGF
jgi:hypothetical protein